MKIKILCIKTEKDLPIEQTFDVFLTGNAEKVSENFMDFYSRQMLVNSESIIILIDDGHLLNFIGHCVASNFISNENINVELYENEKMITSCGYDVTGCLSNGWQYCFYTPDFHFILSKFKNISK